MTRLRNSDERARRRERELALDPTSVEAKARVLQEQLRSGQLSAAIAKRAARLGYAPALLLGVEKQFDSYADWHAYHWDEAGSYLKWLGDHPWWRDAAWKVQVAWAAGSVYTTWVEDWASLIGEAFWGQPAAGQWHAKTAADNLLAALNQAQAWAAGTSKRKALVAASDEAAVLADLCRQWDTSDQIGTLVDGVDQVIYSAVYPQDAQRLTDGAYGLTTQIDRAVWTAFTWYWAEEDRIEAPLRLARLERLRDEFCETMLAFDLRRKR